MSGRDMKTRCVTRRVFDIIAAMVIFGAAAPASAQGMPDTAEGWFNYAESNASMRLGGVHHYVERIQGGEIPGLRAALGPGQTGACVSDCRVYTTVDVPLADGSTLKAGHLLSPSEVAILAGRSPSAAMMDVFAGGYGGMQEIIGENADEMMGPFGGMARAAFGDISLSNNEVREDIENRSWEQESGSGPDECGTSFDGRQLSPEECEGLSSNEREAPWLNPFRMLGAGSYMFSETATAVQNAEIGLGQSANQALADAERQRQLFENTEIVGIEDIGGSSAVHIALPTGASGGPPVDVDDQSFLPTGAGLWIDTETGAILKHRVDGTVTADGQTRKVFIESERSDFRNVAGSDMYEPYRRVMRMGGMLDKTQMAEMEQARKQLAEFDEQMASMPASQRAMLENMMGGQMDALRSMSQSGTIEYVEVIKEILVNPDLKALYATGMGGAGTLAMLPTSGLSLLARIQTDLITLGYEPGNSDGVADALTTVAISQFQAEHKLEVTGEPSEALAATLADLVAN
jgi:hypothetical protein